MRRVVGTIVLILLMWCFGLALIVQAEHSRQDDWTDYIELICQEETGLGKDRSPGQGWLECRADRRRDGRDSWNDLCGSVKETERSGEWEN